MSYKTIESGQYMSCMTTESRNRYVVLENRMTRISKSSFKQWCLTIPPISTKRTASSHLNWTQKSTKAYDVENAGPSFGHAQKYGRFKLVYGVKSTQ
jgi:hypothetical protein